MRRLVKFACEGETLHATLDEAPGAVGLLVLSGGNEIRIGAHRGMARLAGDLSAQGIPTFRFDRRGIGDSTGTNRGFESSAPDIEAAIDAFREACVGLRAIVAFGNCDAASALLLHRPAAVEGYVIANPWAFPNETGLPPPAAIKAHYRQRLLSLEGWRKLLTGSVDLRKLVRGIGGLSQKKEPGSLVEQLAHGMVQINHPVRLLIALRDGTGLAFLDAFRTNPAFDPVRARITVTEIDSSSHSFAPDEDYDILCSTIHAAIKEVKSRNPAQC